MAFAVALLAAGWGQSAGLAQAQTPLVDETPEPGVVSGFGPVPRMTVAPPARPDQLRAPLQRPGSLEEQIAQLRQSPPTLSQFAVRPTDLEVLEVYPVAAFEDEASGAAFIQCTVSPALTLNNCTIDASSAGRSGFAEAALALAPKFRVSPSATLTRGRYSLPGENGERVTGGGETVPLIGTTVTVQVRFSYLRALAAMKGGVRLTNALIGGDDTPPTISEVQDELKRAFGEVAARGPLTSEQLRTVLRDQMAKRPDILDQLDTVVDGGGRTSVLRLDTSNPNLFTLTSTTPEGRTISSMSIRMVQPPGG